MNNKVLQMMLVFFTVLFFAFSGNSSYAQPCNLPVKQVVLHDLSGNYYVYWKPAPGSGTIINYKVQLQCVSPVPCFFTINVTDSNVILMNGGYLGVQIPALPGQANMVKLSILPPNCDTQFAAAFVLSLDIITDNLDLAVASCDSDTCKLVVSKWTKLKNLTDYVNLKCGGGGAAPAPATTVTAIDAPVAILLRKNSTGKWQLKSLDSLVCDSCYVFNFQITCSNGSIYYVQDTICFNYTGPPIGCRLSDGIWQQQLLTIFPNPVTDRYTLQLDLDEPAIVSVRIYNSLGKIVSIPATPGLTDAGENQFEFSADGLAPGMYVIEVKINNEIKRIKLMKI